MSADPRRGGSSSRIRMLGPLRLRDFRLLWTGMSASLMGDGIFLVALAWQVYDLSNAPTALATVGAAMTLPHVAFLLLGGVVSDRYERRRVMLAADCVRGLAMAALGVLSVSGALELWMVVALAAVHGGGTAFFGPAFDAIVPDIVPPALLGDANALDQFVRPVMLRLAGPALGGLLISLAGAGAAFLINAGTFAASVVALLLIRGYRSPHEAPSRDRGSTLREIREGFGFVRSRVWLWGTFLGATIAYLLFMGPTEVLLPFLVKNSLGGSASTLGAILALGGFGAVCGALVVGQRGMPRRHITFMYVTWAVATFAVAGFGLARLPWQAMLASFVFNSLEAAGTVVWATTKHRLVPTALLGRVSSFDWFISIALVPVSFGLTGPVAAAIGARATLVGAGVIGGAVTLGFLFLPGMREVERSGGLQGAAVAPSGVHPSTREMVEPRV